MPADDRYRKSEFKQQIIANTDYVEVMEYVLIALGIFNFISGLYRHYYARLNAAQQLAALYNAQNTPPVQRRNSMALLRVADAQWGINNPVGNRVNGKQVHNQYGKLSFNYRITIISLINDLKAKIHLNK